MIAYRTLKTAVILTTLLMLSCAPQVEIRRPSVEPTRVTLAQLQGSWQKYFIHYSTRIVVFDPVNDDKTVVVDGDWIRVEDAAKLAEIFSRLALNPRFDPDEILEIRAAGGELFGYMVVAYGDRVRVQAAEANTVRLYYSPQREPDAP